LSKGGYNGVNNDQNPDGSVDNSKTVCDFQASNAKQLLNTYIYDFLLKSRLPNTAKHFVNEAEIPINTDVGNLHSPGNNSSQPNTPSNQLLLENNLPKISISMDSPQGFLYEWWQIFWDVFNAKNGNSDGPMSQQNKSLAIQYFQMKQRQQQEIPGSQPNMGNFQQFFPNQNQVQFPMQQQQIQPHNPQQIQQQFQPNAHPPQNPQQIGQPQQHPSQQGPMNVPPTPTGPGPYNIPPGLDPQQQQRYVMQMFLKQQQQQQQQQGGPGQQPIPQHMQSMGGDSQMQMNMAVGNNMNVQQQMFFNHQNAQQPQQRVQQQMNNLRQQAAVQAQQAQQAQAQNQLLQPPHSQSPAAGAIQPGQIGAPVASGVQVKSSDGSANNSPATVQRMNQVNQFNQPVGVNNGQQQFPQQVGGVMPNQGFNNMRGGGSNANANSSQTSPVMYNGVSKDGNKNMNALQDYQMQLMLLEKQNKKRLDFARNNGNPDANLGFGGLPPNQQPMGNQQIQPPQVPNLTGMGQSPQNLQKPSPNTANNSPHNTNKPSPSLGNGKKKKDQGSKRSRKSSVANGPVSASQNSTQAANTPSLLKKEYTTPLTPASEPSADANKRKRKNSVSAESPKKQTKASGQGTKIDKPISENPETKEETLAPSFNEPIPKDQIFNVDILGNGGTDTQNYFGNTTGDIDFDFNQFLDSNADATLGDGINGFNWGNVDAVENGE
jgi:hypothetical protein